MPERIELHRLGAKARRRIAATGTIELLAEVPRAGRFAATASARIGRRERTIAATGLDVADAGPVRLSMPLSKAARQRLTAGQTLRVRLVLRLAQLRPSEEVRFELKGTR